VTWSIRNNHGGGYSYRLCPLPEGNFTDLTEACFQEHPLDFVEDEQSIVFPDGTTNKLNASQTTFVTEGTTPPGSMWSMIPMVKGKEGVGKVKCACVCVCVCVCERERERWPYVLE
jgi:hypothetical protein